jgi:hypothetical protein
MTPSVEFQVIPKLQEGETLVINVDVGKLPMKKAEEYVANFKESFMKTRSDADTVHYVFVPTRSQG